MRPNDAVTGLDLTGLPGGVAMDGLSGENGGRHAAAEGPDAAILRGERRPDLLRDELLSEIFAGTVARAPDAVAMVCNGVSLTYAQVDAEAEAIARGLVARGAAPGKVVGLWMLRGVDLLIGQIAITRTGAAWLPFDADAPVERIATCLADADAIGLLTDPAGEAKAAASGLTLWTPQAIRDGGTGPRIDARAAGARPDSPAYLIYTSGSTGVPKGIVITQANICHYLRSANVRFGMSADDVVFQGASVAFDLSMEEIWIPYLVGARLFVATPDVIAEADRLPDVLNGAGVTVIDTVPTLLAMLGRDVPSLRLIILGGEACPPALVSRWAKPGRQLFNSYGPTEATVVATMAELRPGDPVTIGGPIPNYSCYVVDEALNLLPAGIEGELLIGGPGVAAGYLQRAALTAEKFIANPFSVEGDPVLYRSGDAVALDPSGDIMFRGRIDDQVKIRGFRVELGEIEAKLTDEPLVSQAAVIVRNDRGIDVLVAFVVPDAGATIDTAALRGALRQRLPAYMVPGRFEYVDQLPRLSSGKVDRKALKGRELAVIEGGGAQEDARSDTEATLLAAARRVFPGQSIPFEADFFTELGGHSLLAAQFISIVRETPALANVTLQDIYQQRSLRQIAATLDQRHALAGGAPPIDLTFAPPPFMRRFLCGLAQLVALPFILALMTAQWLGVFISYMLLTGENASIFREMIFLMALYVLINFGTIAISFAAKWVILGRTRPGRYPLWGVYYYRLWLVQRLLGLTHIKWFQASPLMRVYMRLLGAKVGRDAIISDIEFGAADLISIGDGASIGSKVKFANVEIVGNEVVVGAIEVGADAYIGSSCVLEHGTRVEDGGELGDLTALAAGTVVGRNEKWDGSPAVRIGMVDAAELPEPAPEPTPQLRRLHNLVYALALIVVPPLGLLPIFPAFRLFDRMEISAEGYFSSFAGYVTGIFTIAWPASFALVLFTIAMVAVLRWTLLPTRVKPGRYPVYSAFYLRKWLLSFIMEVTLETLSSLFATVYMRGWYRLMGARIGKGSEISTNLSGRYDLIEIGEKNFIADEVVLGDEDIRRGWMDLKPIKTGPRVFVGNDAVVAPGTTIEEGSLIGVKSKPPASQHVGREETWFGSPPIKLPTRQKVDLGQNWTYEPPLRMKILRAAFEALHISLPTALFITLGTISIERFIGDPLLAGDWSTATFMFVASSVVISLFMAAVVIGVKWAMIGRYKPQMQPMWSFWAMKTEMVAVMYWGLSGRVLNEHLRGTPFLPMLLRLYGAKIGKGVYLDMTDLTEFDCVTIGDFAALNSMSCLQTHLYEDRVMKIGRIEVGAGVVVGAGSTVLYDTKIGNHARLGPLTLVMKGESIPGNTTWGGSPAEPVVVHRHAGEETEVRRAA